MFTDHVPSTREGSIFTDHSVRVGGVSGHVVHGGVRGCMVWGGSGGPEESGGPWSGSWVRLSVFQFHVCTHHVIPCVNNTRNLLKCIILCLCINKISTITLFG